MGFVGITHFASIPFLFPFLRSSLFSLFLSLALMRADSTVVGVGSRFLSTIMVIRLWSRPKNHLTPTPDSQNECLTPTPLKLVII